MADVNVRRKIVINSSDGIKSVQEKESIISAEPRDAKTVTLGTDLSVRTSHSCQILILFSVY